MLVQRHGLHPGRHVALFGEWDPLSPHHEQLFATELKSAAAHDLPLLVVTFDPSPVSLLMGAATRPPFDDVAARLAAQERCGVSSRITIGLTRDEVDRAGVVELLDELLGHVDLGELVLGVRQTLGTQDRGNDIAIQAAAASRGIVVRRLPGLERRTTVADARSALCRGQLARAVELVGHPLYWSRPESGSLTLPWPTGCYQAVPLREPTRGGEPADGALPVWLTDQGEGARLPWPDDIPWLGFVAGPADSTVSMDAATRAVG